MSTKYLNATETAKLVRQSLKEAFPDVKFSVRRKTYSGGASVSVGWQDGPNEAQVAAVGGIFRGSVFDSSQDLRLNTYAMMDGQLVSFGADYIHFGRICSKALCESVARTFVGLQYKITGTDAYGWGFAGDYDELHDLRTALAKRSDRLAVGKSATAGKVIYCGHTSSNSQVGAVQVDE